MDYVYLLPWATNRVADAGFRLFYVLSAVIVARLLYVGGYELILPTILLCYLMSWGFAHTGYVLIVSALWLWRTIPRLIASIIKQREAAYLTPQRDIAGRDINSLLPVTQQPATPPEPETWLEFLQRSQAESQRAIVAAKLANMKQGARTDISPIGETSQSQAAELLNVSP